MIENCPMRHENGNCIPAGGFCTANKNICEALLNAYRMGKAQLSQEGTTSDLISRQAAIDALSKFVPYAICDESTESYTNGLTDAYNLICQLPPVQPEPQEGHWKKDETDDCPPVFRRFRICSVCRAIETSETNYCPHCGAKMTISTK